MVGGLRSHVANLADGLQGTGIVIHEFSDLSFPCRVEVVGGMLPVRFRKYQLGIACRAAPWQEEIYIESDGKRNLGIGPFRKKDIVRIIGMHPCGKLLPFPAGNLETVVVLDEALGHVHPETVRTLVEPEHHDIAQFLPDCAGTGSIDSLLPGMGGVRVGKTIVQRRLGFVVVLVVIFRTRGVLFHEFPYRTRFRIRLAVPFSNVFLVLRADLVGPDVIVAVTLVGIRLHRLEKPLVAVAGVTCYKIHDHFDSSFVRLGEQVDHVRVRSETRVHFIIVDDVITAVHPPGLIDRVQPDCGDSHALDIIKFGDDALDVPDSVPV